MNKQGRCLFLWSFYFNKQNCWKRQACTQHGPWSNSRKRKLTTSKLINDHPTFLFACIYWKKLVSAFSLLPTFFLNPLQCGLWSNSPLKSPLIRSINPDLSNPVFTTQSYSCDIWHVTSCLFLKTPLVWYKCLPLWAPSSTSFKKYVMYYALLRLLGWKEEQAGQISVPMGILFE